MHELSIAQSVVAAVTERADGRQVRRVSIVVGRLSGVAPDALSFSFGLVCEGTVAEGAELVVDEPPGRARCRACDTEFGVTDLVLQCRCGSTEVELVGGRELLVSSMELV